jgi:hypothetical protein
MDKLLHEAENVFADLDRALQAYTAIQANIRTLQDYYEGGLWMKDFEDDRAGKLPRDIPCGVLSEDAVYDLLTDQFRLKETFRDLGATEITDDVAHDAAKEA